MLSPSELTNLLRRAAEAVEQAGLPEDLRPIAFQRSLDALGVGGGAAAGGNAPPLGAGADGDQRHTREGLASIASRLGLDKELVASVFEEDDGQLRLIVKRAMLPEPSRKAASMRHVALLVTVGRQAAGLEEYTAYGSIREECRDLKVYDGPNFASEVGKLEFRTRGGRNSREARANRHHFDEAAALIRTIVQGDQ